MFEVIAFLFLLFFPGYAVVRITANKTNTIWMSAVLAYGVSLISYILLGLALNTTLPMIGISDPLSQFNFGLAVLVLNLVLWCISLSLKRLKIAGVVKHFEGLSFTQLIVIVLIPVPALISIIGTLLLNNEFSNAVSLIGLGLIAAQIMCAAFLSRFFNNKDNFLIFNLLCIATGAVLMISLRGYFVSGSDIMLEHRMADITKQRMLWVPDNPNHPYNACLSITILPAALSNLTNLSLNTLFKLMLQLSTILSVIPIYMVARKFVSHGLSYSAAIAFITFPAFIGIMPMHLRQASAMLFFFLSILLIIYNDTSYLRRIFLYLFTVGLLISHYSTTYLAFAIYLAFFGGSLVVVLISRIPWKGRIKEQYFAKQALFRYVNPIFLIFMAMCIYVWYFQITVLSAGLTNFVQKLSLGFKSDTSLEIREDTSLKNQLNIFFKPTQTADISNEYVKTLKREYVENIDGFFVLSQQELDNYSLTSLPQTLIKPKLETDLLKTILIVAEFIKKTYKVLTMIGVLYVFVSLFFYQKKKYDTSYVLFLGIAISVLIIFTTMPFFTIDYDVFRTYHQLLIVLALMPVMGLLLFGKILKLPIQPVVLLFFTLYFILSTGLFYEIVGGYPDSLVLRNEGDDFNRYFIKTADAKSTNWLMENRELDTPIQTDTYTKHKMRYLNTDDIPIHDELTKLSIAKYSYVFLASYQVKDNVAYKNFHNRLIKHPIETQFISSKKHKVYSNGVSEIYR